MKKLMLATVGALGLATASMAALPTAAAPQLPLVKADYYCGPGWHLNYWDHCVPNRYGYYYGGPTFVFGFGFGDRDRGHFGFRDRDEGFRFGGHMGHHR